MNFLKIRKHVEVKAEKSKSSQLQNQNKSMLLREEFANFSKGWPRDFDLLLSAADQGLCLLHSAFIHSSEAAIPSAALAND